MKQLFFVFSFILVASFSANAQACNKSASAGKSCCTAKKTASAGASDDTKVASVMMEADVAAKGNENITKRTCEISGTTAYYQKSVCATSGNISWEEVQYDANTKSFTKVASASMERTEDGKKVEAKSCAGKSEGKACCAKKDGAKACAGKEKGTK
jgi:hypothetical protein